MAAGALTWPRQRRATRSLTSLWGRCPAAGGEAGRFPGGRLLLVGGVARASRSATLKIPPFALADRSSAVGQRCRAFQGSDLLSAVYPGSQFAVGLGADRVEVGAAPPIV